MIQRCQLVCFKKKKINFVEKDAKNNEKICVSARVSANDMKGRKTKEQR